MSGVMRLPRVARVGVSAPAASRPRAAARAARPAAQGPGQAGRSRRAAPARLWAPSRSGLALMAGTPRDALLLRPKCGVRGQQRLPPGSL